MKETQKKDLINVYLMCGSAVPRDTVSYVSAISVCNWAGATEAGGFKAMSGRSREKAVKKKNTVHSSKIESAMLGR